MIGGHPTVDQDIPVSAVLLFIYLVGAIGNQIIFQLNRRKGHRFYMSWVMFGFNMARVLTMVLRIAWTTRPTNVSLAIATEIFANVGILAIYIILLLLVMRVFRATQPSLGWNKPFRRTMHVSYFLLAIALILTVAFTVVTFYTLDPTLRTVALWIQRIAVLYMLIFNIVSVVLLLLSWLLPRTSDVENFGTGSMNSKFIILSVTVFFSVFIAGFRMGLAWSKTRSAANPPWYDSKAALYVIEFGFEIIVVYVLLVTRFDKRFWVPNGSTKPGDYSQLDLDDSLAGKTSEQDIGLENEKTLKHDETLESVETSVQDNALENEKTSKQDETVEHVKTSEHDNALEHDKQDETLENEKTPKQDEPLEHEKTSEQDTALEHEKTSKQNEQKEVSA